MKIEIEGFLYYEVPVTFRLSRYTALFSPQIIVLLRVNDIEGFGSSPVHHTSGSKMFSFVKQRLLPLFRNGLEVENLKEAREFFRREFLIPYSSIVHAFDVALWDAESKLLNSSLWRLLSTQKKRDNINITEQIFIDSYEKIKESLKAMIGRGTRFVKVKVGRDVHHDVEYIKKLYSDFGDKLKFKLDVNETYNLKDAIHAAKEFKKFGVILLEDPLPCGIWNDYAVLREESDIPIMVDGGITTPEELLDVIKQEAIDVLNIKLNRVGGITNALILQKICEENGVDISVGCAEDLGSSMAAILHLSSVIPNYSGTEGVGCYRLGFDIGDREFLVKDGCLAIPNTPGIGVAFVPFHLEKASSEKGFVIHNLLTGNQLTKVRLMKEQSKVVLYNLFKDQDYRKKIFIPKIKTKFRRFV